MSETSSENPDVRVGDRERNAAMERLGNQFADGYLDVDEFSKRTEAAAVAKTRSELQKLFRDLPAETSPQNTQNSSLSHQPVDAEQRPVDTDQELQNLIDKGDKLKVVDAIAGGICAVTIGLMIFTDLDEAWVGFIIACVVAILGRMALKINDDDEKILNEISKDDAKRRTERLRLAAEKRRQIQQRQDYQG